MDKRHPHPPRPELFALLLELFNERAGVLGMLPASVAWDSEPTCLCAASAPLPRPLQWSMAMDKQKLAFVWHYSRQTREFLPFEPTAKDGSPLKFGREISVSLPKDLWGRLLAELREDSQEPFPAVAVDFD